MDARCLDTLLFAPASREVIADAALSRQGMRMIETERSLMRVRDVGDGPPVVVMPDGPNTIEQYDALFGALDDHRVVAIEIPGFGFSWAKDPEALSFDGTVEAVADALEVLGVADAVITGTCVQAFVAIAVAERHPGLASAVVATQCPSLGQARTWSAEVIDPEGTLRIPWVGQASWRQHRETLGIDAWYSLAAGPGAPLDEWRATAREVIVDKPSTNALSSLIQGWMGDNGFALGSVEVPATILWGDADRSHRIAGSAPESMLEHLPAAEIIRVESAGHFCDLESLDVFCEIVRSYSSR